MNVNPGICSSYVFDASPVTSGADRTGSSSSRRPTPRWSTSAVVGMAPMRSYLFHLFHTVKTGRKVTFYYASRVSCSISRTSARSRRSSPTSASTWSSATRQGGQLEREEKRRRRRRRLPRFRAQRGDRASPQAARSAGGHRVLCGPPLMNQPSSRCATTGACRRTWPSTTSRMMRFRTLGNPPASCWRSRCGRDRIPCRMCGRKSRPMSGVRCPALPRRGPRHDVQHQIPERGPAGRRRLRRPAGDGGCRDLWLP